MPDVWYYDFTGDGYCLSDLRGLLSRERYEYCYGMKSKAAGLRSAYGFLLLRYALKKRYGITEMPEYTVGEHGKPLLINFPGIFFNISHSQNSVVCAVSDTPVGVDIQDIRHLTLNVGRKFLSGSELEKVSAITDPSALDDELCRIWCIKESYGKMTGKGFGEGFCSVDHDRLLEEKRVSVTRKHDFYISICI
mgnify:CR=1 FL=1